MIAVSEPKDDKSEPVSKKPEADKPIGTGSNGETKKFRRRGVEKKG